MEAESGPAGPILVLRVAGEIDMLTGPQLQTALFTALRRAPCDLVVDLAGVGFCCVRGCEVLADAARAARAEGIGYAVSGLSGHLDRVVTLLWSEEQFVRHRSAAVAVLAIRLDHTFRLTAPRRPDVRAPELYSGAEQPPYGPRRSGNGVPARIGRTTGVYAPVDRVVGSCGCGSRPLPPDVRRRGPPRYRAAAHSSVDREVHP